MKILERKTKEKLKVISVKTVELRWDPDAVFWWKKEFINKNNN